jgi:hypothetical protein
MDKGILGSERLVTPKFPVHKKLVLRREEASEMTVNVLHFFTRRRHVGYGRAKLESKSSSKAPKKL